MFQNSLHGKDIFSAVLPLCKKNYTIISNVFPNPEQVMSKFVLNIFLLKLQKYIQTKLADKNDVEKYLKNLYEMYTRYLLFKFLLKFKTLDSHKT